jgi:predicted RNase H-like nuclease
MQVRYPARFSDLIGQKPKPKIIAIDIPIGLWERGDRPCDKTARSLLGWPRRCSVFPPPPRSALKAKDYKEARELSMNVSGRSLSKQSFAITAKICEVDEWMNPRRQKRVHEVHPEVSFWALNKRHALKYNKKTKEGVEERLQLLRRLFAGLDDLLREVEGHHAAVDDFLDAAVAVWTARRIAAGDECRLTSQARDRKGLRMEIVY